MGKLSLKELYEKKREYFKKYNPYCMRFWSEYDYTTLKNIIARKKAGRGDNGTYNDIIIMCDTETSKTKVNTIYYEDTVVTDKNGYASVIKTKKYNPVENYVVAWTISLRSFDYNLVTLYGNTPDEFCQCIKRLQESLPGDETFYYFHNLAYDYVFLRKFLFKYFGHPDKQLNTKPHYPIYLKWGNHGITIKDSLILAQRKLEKWAEDLDVEHKKAVETWIDKDGNVHKKWDYDKIRTQREVFTRHELDYIEHDTLAGVECIDATMKALNKRIYSMPYTATGIPREECRKIAKKNGGRQSFLSMVLSYEQYIQATRCYHGGYTHANRYKIDKLILNVICHDFSSSYPYCMLSERYPAEKWSQYEDCDIDDILSMSDKYAFMFKLTLVGSEERPLQLKDKFNPMPALQSSKCVEKINPIEDNGRIIKADYVEIYLTDVDAQIIKDTYTWDKHICTEVIYSRKDYLPRWFTDYVYKLYSDKCTLKNGDPVLYAIAKAKLNSLYGMCVQKCLKDNMVEDFVTGEYKKEPPINQKTGEEMTPEEEYQKYIDNENSFLNYSWGVYVTSYAMKNLFELSKCCVKELPDGTTENCFVYSDTDSIYATYWNEEKLKEYNEKCVAKLRANGYEPVKFDCETYIPGVAEFDGAYSEFKVLGAKRYCCRYSDDKRNKEKNRGKLKITVAGVPKSGVSLLSDNINNFTSSFIFSGEGTGKLTHHYIFKDDIETLDNGIVVGDSVDLTPCDYLLSSINVVNIDDLYSEEIEVQVYD